MDEFGCIFKPSPGFALEQKRKQAKTAKQHFKIAFFVSAVGEKSIQTNCNFRKLDSLMFQGVEG